MHHILCMIFQVKCLSYYILLTDQVSLSDCFYFTRYLAICTLQLFVNQAVMSQHLKLTLFSNQAVLQHDQNVMAKIWISWGWKELLMRNKRHFSPFLKGLPLPKIASDLRMHLWSEYLYLLIQWLSDEDCALFWFYIEFIFLY